MSPRCVRRISSVNVPGGVMPFSTRRISRMVRHLPNADIDFTTGWACQLLRIRAISIACTG